MILKINILAPVEGRETIVAPKQENVIGYEANYEKAPTDDINTTMQSVGITTPMSNDE